MGYDRGDSFLFDFEPNGISFHSKSKGKLSPRSYHIQFERKSRFLSAQWSTFLRQGRVFPHSATPGSRQKIKGLVVTKYLHILNLNNTKMLKPEIYAHFKSE